MIQDDLNCKIIGQLFCTIHDFLQKLTSFSFPVIFSLAFSINGFIIAFFPGDKEIQNISGILVPGFCESCSGQLFSGIETLKVEKYRAGCFDLISIFFVGLLCLYASLSHGDMCWSLFAIYDSDIF